MGKTLTLSEARAHLAEARARLLAETTALERIRALRAAALVSPAAAAGLSPDQLDKEEQDALLRYNAAKGTAQRAARALADVLRAELTQASQQAVADVRRITDEMDELGQTVRAARQRSKQATWQLYALDRLAGQAVSDPLGAAGPLLAVNIP